MMNEQRYKKIINELKNLNMQIEEIDLCDRVAWLPTRDSRAKNGDALICIYCELEKLSIGMLIKNPIYVASHEYKEIMQFTEKDDIDYHTVLSKIINYYYENIDKTI